MIGDVVQLLAANACFLAAGMGVLRLAGRRSAAGLTSLGLAYVAGVAAVGVLATLMLLAGAALTVPEVVALCAALLLAGLLGRPLQDEGPPSLRTQAWVAVPGAFLVAVFFAFLLVDLAFQPLSTWDAWQHWGAKARALVVLDGLDASLLGAPAYVPWNPDYPLLVPALEAIDFRFMGVNTQVVHLQFGLLLAGFVLSVVRLVGPLVLPLVLWPVLAAFAWAPSVGFQTASAYADVPLGVFVGLAAVCAWRWLEAGHPGDLGLVAVFGAAALATKMEGAVWMGALGVLLVVLALRRSRRRAALAAAALGASLVGILPWRLWTIAEGIEGTYSTAAVLDAATSGAAFEQLDRIPAAAGSVLADALDPQAWLLLVPAAAAAWLLAWRRDRRDDGVVLFGGTAALSLAGLIALYWLTPYELDWHLERSSARVVAPLVLLGAACTPLLLTHRGREISAGS